MRLFFLVLLLAIAQSMLYLIGYHLLYTYGPSMLVEQKGVNWGIMVVSSLYFFAFFSIIDWAIKVYRPNWHFLLLIAAGIFFAARWFPLWSSPGLLLSLAVPAILAYLITHSTYKYWVLRL